MEFTYYSEVDGFAYPDKHEETNCFGVIEGEGPLRPLWNNKGLDIPLFLDLRARLHALFPDLSRLSDTQLLIVLGVLTGHFMASYRARSATSRRDEWGYWDEDDDWHEPQPQTLGVADSKIPEWLRPVFEHLEATVRAFHRGE